MNNTSLKSKIALVFCGHGSTSKIYKLDFLSFIDKIKLKFPNNKIFYCFIEKDKPFINDCLSSIYSKFHKIIFIPLLIFKGTHYEVDIKEAIYLMEKKNNSKIIIAKNLNLGKEIASIIQLQVRKKLKNTNQSLLVILSSFSKSSSVYRSIYYYSRILMKNLKFKNCFIGSFGNERLIIKNLKEQKDKIFLHPIFLFNGYLYDSILKKFSNEFKRRLFFIEPLLQNEKFFYYVYNKINLILERE